MSAEARRLLDEYRAERAAIAAADLDATLHPDPSTPRTSLAHVIGDDPSEGFAGPRAWWNRTDLDDEGCQQYVWTKTAWRNVATKAAERREVRYVRYEQEKERARAHRATFSNVRAHMERNRGPMGGPPRAA